MLKNVKTSALTGLMFLIFFANEAVAQVVINEICPSNVSVISNASDKFDDWVEIYNPGSSSINIGGYKLTDNISEPDKFIFPSTILSPSQRIVVFASDDSRIPADHYEMAIGSNAQFSYATGSSSIDTNWRNPSFNDASWSKGPGGLGFGDDDDATIIPNSISVLMRKSFTVTDTASIVNAIFMMDYDDGFVAYLNGVEIARANISLSIQRPAWNTPALSSHEAQMNLGYSADSFFISNEVLKTILKPGVNVFAVETHNYSDSPDDMTSRPFLIFGIKNSSNFFASPPSWFVSAHEYLQTDFHLRSAGETVFLLNPAGAVIDQQIYWQISKDHTYGRIPDGSNNWCYISTPSPGFSNNSSVCNSGYTEAPSMSPDGGFFNSTQLVSLSNPHGGVIRYTLNGDEPQATSPLYSGPISITATKTLRARVFETGLLPGPSLTRTFFINEDPHLPVITLTTDSSNLWNYNTGIYVLGPNADTANPYFGANFWQPWVKPVSVEYFDKSRQRVLSFDADFEIYGNYSRAKPQKSFEVKLQDYYGSGQVSHPLISDKSFITKYDRLILRNSGTDCNNVHFRDALMQRIMRNTFVDYVAAEPVKVFLNGEQWGVYMLSEKHNQNWIEANFGYDKDEIDLLEEIGGDIEQDIGSNTGYFELFNFVTSANPVDSGFYSKVASQLDLENFTDYLIAETYYNNGDWIGEWTNNIIIWKAKKEYAKWRYILIDTDYGFDLKGDVTDNRLSMAINPDAFSHTSDMFDALLKNPQFKNRFINRYADLINTIYLPTNVEGVMKQFRDSMAWDMIQHFDKWGSDTSKWNTRINNMMLFVTQRPQIVRDQIQSQFNLQSQVLLTVEAYPPGSGRIEISTIVPDSLPWSGVYFHGNPVTITAIPNPGFTFDHWSSDVTISTNDYKKRTTYDFSSNDHITAYFSGSSAPALLTVSEINYHSSEEYHADDWFELHNYGTFDLDISGWSVGDGDEHTKYVFPVSTVIPPNGYLVITEDSLEFKKFYPHLTNRTGHLKFNLANGGEEILIQDYSGAEFLKFNYSDDLPWPLDADGYGYTCELIDPAGNLNSGSNWFAGCFGGSPGKGFSNNLSTLIDISGSSYFCAGSNTKVTTTTVSDYQYQWKFEGTDLPGETKDTLTVSQDGVYQLRVNCNGCTAISPEFTIVQKSISQDPVVSDISRCKPGAVVLSANSTDTVYWYNAPGGSLLGIGNSYVTDIISTDKTFYAKAGNACPSDEVALTVRITNGVCDGLTVYPNPVLTGIAVLHNDELNSGEATLLITDMQGSVVANQQLQILPTGNSGSIDLPYDNGIYNFTVYQNDKIFNSKVVLIR